MALSHNVLGQHQGLRSICDEEEEELVKWITGCAEVEYAKSVCDIRAVVGAIVLNKLGVDNLITISQIVFSSGTHICLKALHSSE